ncbi:MAG: RnfABCDGE type electron transport complex subunit D [Eubacteriales bacterium]|jgi:electron transport complex protein RnfD|nr:RnfABCDGE type electron transport complex subunit D [Clostridiales bacterium]
MNELLTVNVSPHIYTKRDTTSIMLDVVIALLPASAAAIIFFGLRAAILIASCTVSAVLFEFIFNKIVKKDNTIRDLSAVVTGLLLALNLPASVPVWQAVLGSAVAIIIVKCLFGGIGDNFANPAITARVVLLLAFPGTVTAAVFPSEKFTDIISGATPLAVISGQEGTLPSLLDMFFGARGGAIGETSALALLIGGVYLLARRVITWHTPVAFVGTVFILTLLLGEEPLYQIMSGGLLIGAIFMATDYTTSPTTEWGKIIFGFGCGLLTVIIRVWGTYPEGVSFAILFMNILCPYINRWTERKPFGGVPQ